MTPPGQSVGLPVGYHYEETICLDCGETAEEMGHPPILEPEVQRGLYSPRCDRCGKKLEPKAGDE
jgi:DNA-directed RNA polymerase subunit RPC12/RpoP